LVRKTPIPADSCGSFSKIPRKGETPALGSRRPFEEKLMGSVAAQTTTGEAQLYERNSDLIFRYCLRMLGTREDAEDAAQTTFFQALRALRRGVVPAFEQAWLLTIARNECKSRYRAGSRRRQRELAHDPQSLADLAEAPNGGDGRLVGVQQALVRLPEMQRRALLLREWQGRSYADIAQELGVTRPAVEALLFRARRGLARELGEETTTRRHALDVVSLLGALKSVLGGGAAVKVAVGIAAMATVGTVAAGSGPAPMPAIPVRDAARADRQVFVPARKDGREAVVADAASRRRKQPAKAAPAAKHRESVRPHARSKAKPVSSAPAVPAAPTAEQAAPQSSPAQSPVAAPSVPAVPQAPAAPTAPSPPPVPTAELPQVPPLPEAPPLPQVQVPDVPPLPQAPDVPLVPDVPELR
jgi:RNA polymerase sigma factor (sigma-70 family)